MQDRHPHVTGIQLQEESKAYRDRCFKPDEDRFSTDYPGRFHKRGSE
jgi:hypothetical protein